MTLSTTHLERVDRLSKLRPLQGVGNRGVETPLGAADHLGTDSYAPFVQELGGDLVALSVLAQDVGLRDSHVVECEHAGSGSGYS
jgi:hypothetical protein